MAIASKITIREPSSSDDRLLLYATQAELPKKWETLNHCVGLANESYRAFHKYMTGVRGELFGYAYSVK